MPHPTKLKTRCSLVYASLWRLWGRCPLLTYLGCGLNSVPGSCSAEVAIFLLAHNQETLSALRGHLLSLSDESQWKMSLSHFESLTSGRGQSPFKSSNDCQAYSKYSTILKVYYSMYYNLITGIKFILFRISGDFAGSIQQGIKILRPILEFGLLQFSIRINISL